MVHLPPDIIRVGRPKSVVIRVGIDCQGALVLIQRDWGYYLIYDHPLSSDDAYWVLDQACITFCVALHCIILGRHPRTFHIIPISSI